MACPPTVRKGSTGSTVVNLQQRLVQRGYSLVVDGIFGNATHGAVVSFQQSVGVTADGIVGPVTWGKLGAC